jgi:DinB superfamily
MTQQLDAYLEIGVGAHVDNAVVAWAFDLDLWHLRPRAPGGRRRGGAGARRSTRPRQRPTRRGGRAHPRRRADVPARPPTRHPGERAQTLAILRAARQQTLALVSACPDAVLDWDDPQRVLPPWASWRTLRQMAWHVADTESRYYLPRLGLPSRPRDADLLGELQRSAAPVQAAVRSVAPALLRRSDGEVWTTTKLLRRLAWHERGELVVMRRLAERARQHLPGA